MLHLAGLKRIAHLVPQDSTSQANLGLFAVQFDHYYFLFVYILSSHVKFVVSWSMDGRKCSLFLANYN